MVLSEAGASGMAIISTNVAAIPEFVRNGETGLTVPAGDAASLTQALRDLATNPALRMTLGERAMAHVTRHYDAPTNASRLLGLLKAEADAARAEGLAVRHRASFLGACASVSIGRRSCGEGVCRACDGFCTEGGCGSFRGSCDQCLFNAHNSWQVLRTHVLF